MGETECGGGASPSVPRAAECSCSVDPVLWIEDHGLWGQTAHSWTPASNTSQPCGLNKLLTLSRPHFSCLYNGDNNSTCSPGLCVCEGGD